jgi:hypothetical protein
MNVVNPPLAKAALCRLHPRFVLALAPTWSRFDRAGFGPALPDQTENTRLLRIRVFDHQRSICSDLTVQNTT